MDVIKKRNARVFLVDEHAAVREGLAMLLAQEDHIVCGEAGSRTETLEKLERSQPDIALVDLSLHDESGLALVADLRKRHMPVLIYSMHDDSDTVEQAFRYGANGYVTKREVSDVLLEAVRHVMTGRRYISPLAAQSLAKRVLPPYEGGRSDPAGER